MNARIHLNILEAWRLHQPQAKLISTGSSCAYPESDTPLAENAFQSGPVHPSVRGYALAKQLLAVGSQVYAEQFGLHYLHCILATVYGPYNHMEPERSHFMGAMLDRAIREKAAGRREFTVWGKPDTVRELLFVEDQIEAILAADRVFDNTLLNCTASQPVTLGEAAQAVLDVLAWPVAPVYPEGTFQGARYKLLDSSRFLDAQLRRPRRSGCQPGAATAGQDAISRHEDGEYAVEKTGPVERRRLRPEGEARGEGSDGRQNCPGAHFRECVERLHWVQLEATP